MAIAKSELKKITDAPNAVDSFKAVLAALVADQTISADVAGLVGHALDHARAELEPAIIANTKN